MAWLWLWLCRCAQGERHMNMETLYEYGSRAGFWRLHRLFTRKQLPVTVYAVAMVGVRLCALTTQRQRRRGADFPLACRRWSGTQTLPKPW